MTLWREERTLQYEQPYRRVRGTRPQGQRVLVPRLIAFPEENTFGAVYENPSNRNVSQIVFNGLFAFLRIELDESATDVVAEFQPTIEHPIQLELNVPTNLESHACLPAGFLKPFSRTLAHQFFNRIFGAVDFIRQKIWSAES